jgi:hypothetical protein
LGPARLIQLSGALLNALLSALLLSVVVTFSTGSAALPQKKKEETLGVEIVDAKVHLNVRYQKRGELEVVKVASCFGLSGRIKSQNFTEYEDHVPRTCKERRQRTSKGYNRWTRSF